MSVQPVSSVAMASAQWVSLTLTHLVFLPLVMKIRLCARFIKNGCLDIIWCLRNQLLSVSFSCNNCRFCNNNVGSFNNMETPDKAFGWGRSSSGVLTKRCEFPRLAHTRGHAVATCERRHKKQGSSPP